MPDTAILETWTPLLVLGCIEADFASQYYVVIVLTTTLAHFCTALAILVLRNKRTLNFLLRVGVRE